MYRSTSVDTASLVSAIHICLVWETSIRAGQFGEATNVLGSLNMNMSGTTVTRFLPLRSVVDERKAQAKHYSGYSTGGALPSLVSY